MSPGRRRWSGPDRRRQPPQGRRPAANLARQLWSLSKPRIVALLTLTGLAGLVAAGGTTAGTVAAFVVAGAAIAAGSAAFNCYYDRHLDALMARTAGRPLPDGRLDGRVAVGFVVGLLAAGTAIGLLALPVASVGFMWLGVVAYAGVYTVGLKRRHPLGVVIGGSAGSFPVLAGWTAVGPLGPSALAMATLVFVWTPAHAWALAVVYRDDFTAAGVPTLPVVASPARVRRAVWLSALATAATALAVVPLAGGLYAAALVGAIPCYLLAYRTYARSGTAAAAVRAFFTSNLFVAVAFTAWAGARVVGAVPPVALGLEALVVAGAFLALWLSRPRLGDVVAGGRSGWPRSVVRVRARLAGDRAG